MNDAEGDAGAFLIMLLETEALAAAVAQRMKAAGLHNVFRVSEYGLHMYYNIPALVGKVPLSPAGNPWTLPQNSQSVYNYAKGDVSQERCAVCAGRVAADPLAADAKNKRKRPPQAIRQAVAAGEPLTQH